MIAAIPNERVCPQNCFDTGSGGYRLRRMRHLPRAPLENTAYSFICCICFLENTMILKDR